MQGIAFIGPGLSLTALCFASTGVTSGVASLLSCGALGLGAASHSGFWANAVDISPRYAGVLLGISNTVATLPGIIANISTGFILQQAPESGWTIVFGLAISIYAVGLGVYTTWASGDVQFR